MELRQLRYFVAVGEELHFTRAALRLGIATPSLSKQIQTLEQSLETPLLRRNKRAVELTDAGARFLDEARAVLRRAEEAESLVRSAGRGELGQIEVGYVSSAACSGVLSTAVSNYRRKHPKVVLRLKKMETSQQLKELAARHLDIGFLRPPLAYPEGVTGRILLRAGLLLALPATHRLCDVSLIDAHQLKDEDFISPHFERDDGFYPHTAAIAEAGDFKPRVVERAPDYFTIITLVAAGFGIAVVPDACRRFQLPNVVYRRILQHTQAAELAAAYRRSDRTPALKALVSMLWNMDWQTAGQASK